MINLLALKYPCHYQQKYFVIIVCQYFEQVQFVRDLETLKQHRYITLAKIVILNIL